MRAVLLSFPGWLCLFCAPARSVSTVSTGRSASSTNRAVIDTSTGSHSSGTTAEEMASTALDFREMMRKERERAMKKRSTATSANPTRYLSSRRTPLDLKRDHRVAPRADGQGVDGIYYVPGFVTKEEGRLLENAASSGDGGGGGPEWKELYKRRLQIHGGTPHPSGMVEEELPPFLREVCDALVEAGLFPESSPPNHVLLNEYSSGQGIGPHKDGPLYEGRVAILSLGEEACLDFWGSLEDAKSDCAAVAAAKSSDASAADSSLVAGNYATSTCSSSTDTLAEEGNGGGTETDSHGCGGQKKPTRRALASVRCEDCSLVVFEGAAYYDAWHGIASTAGDSITGGAPTAADARDREAGAVRKRLSFTIRRVARVVPADSVMEHPEARSETERRRRGFERSVTETGGGAALPSDI